MFSKNLTFALLVLLGLALVLANPVTQKDFEEQNGENVMENVKEWFYQVGETLKDYHEQSMKSFQDIFDDLKVISRKAVKISQEKFTKLKEKYDDIKEKTKESYEQKGEEWRPYFEKLKNKGDMVLQDLKEKVTEFMRQEKDKLQLKFRKLNEKFTAAIEAGAKKWNDKKDE